MSIKLENIELVLSYSPIDCCFAVWEQIKHHPLPIFDLSKAIFTGTYDEVEEYAKNMITESEKWIDGTRYTIIDKRSIRNDYVPDHPIHPKVKKLLDKWNPNN